MSTREVTKAGVVGLGTMGAGIAQLCIQAGVSTVAVETTPELAERGRDRIASALRKLADKGAITWEQRDETLGWLQPTDDVSALAGCDIVIEAVFESIEVKNDIFSRLERAVEPETVLATNTSALSVTEIAAALEHPERVVGMHFFNPAPVLPLVEVVRAQATSDGAFELAYAFAKRLGKEPIACLDTPGFVVNRILIPVLNDAVRVLDEGVASPEDIDKGMRLGSNWPIGPLALIDLIGVDTYVHVCEALWKALEEQRFAPPQTLVEMLEDGRLGRKSGRGFFEYAVAA